MPMIDTHVHIASPDAAKYPLADAPPFATNEWYKEPRFSIEQVAAEMDAADTVGATLVQAFGAYAYDNSYHADSALKYPGRFVGVCGMSSDQPDAPAVLRTWVEDRGMGGLRLSTRGDGSDLGSRQTDAVLAAAARLGIPVCLLTRIKLLPAVAEMAARFPSITFLVDHCANPERGDAEANVAALQRLSASPNVNLKISVPVLTALERRLTRRIVDAFGADRMCWSTNYPVTDEGSYAATVAAGLAALPELTSAEREALLEGTARRIWPQLKG